MKTIGMLRVLALALLAAASMTVAASAMQQGAVLGANGELYIARGGAYGDLFPGGSAATPTTSVLALDIVGPGNASSRLMVPGTAGDEVESSPYMVFEEDSNTVFLVWETRLNDIHSILNLASFDGTSWSAPIEVTGNPYAIKQSPKLAITRDTFSTAGTNGTSVTKHRTILHLIWEEDSGSGLYQTFYEPVILEEGAYLGWNPYRCLNDLDASDAVSLSFPISTGLVQAPTIQNSGNGQTVIAAFASLKSQRMVTVAIDVLPKQLGRLADDSRATIIDIGARLSFPSNIGPLAQQVRTAMLADAGDLEPEFVKAIADRVYNQLLGGAKQDLRSLSDASRATIIDIGIKLSGHGLKTLKAGESTAQVFEIDQPSAVDVVGSAPPPPPQISNLLQLRVTASLPAPQVGTDGVSVFVSQNGGNSLVSWTETGGLLYLESTAPQGWSDVHELKFSPTLDLAHALTLLEQRAYNR